MVYSAVINGVLFIGDKEISVHMCFKQPIERSGFSSFGTVASLGLALPGAATDGLTPIFPSKSWRSLFSHPYTKTADPVLAVASSQLHNSHLPTSFCPVFFVNLATIFCIRVSPPKWCHPGRSAHPQ